MQGKFDSSHSISTSLVRVVTRCPGSLSRLLLDSQLCCRCCRADIHCLRGWFTIFAPGLQRILSSWDILDFEIAVLVGHSKIRRRHNDDISGHFGMYIAQERSRAEVMELERFLLTLRPSPEIVRKLFVSADRPSCPQLHPHRRRCFLRT